MVRIRPVEHVVRCFPLDLAQGAVGIRHARSERGAVHRRAVAQRGERPVSVRAVAVRVVLPERGAVGEHPVLRRQPVRRVVQVLGPLHHAAAAVQLLAADQPPKAVIFVGILLGRSARCVRGILPRKTAFRIVFVMVSDGAIIIRLGRLPVKQVIRIAHRLPVAIRHLREPAVGIVFIRVRREHHRRRVGRAVR